MLRLKDKISFPIWQNPPVFPGTLGRRVVGAHGDRSKAFQIQRIVRIPKRLGKIPPGVGQRIESASLDGPARSLFPRDLATAQRPGKPGDSALYQGESPRPSGALGPLRRNRNVSP